MISSSYNLTHLQALEAESIHIIREVAAEFERPVMLYSIGEDSADRLHQWDPKNQRPELWNLYNGKVNKGESIRAFPLSNWTELDVWQYIHLENIPIVPLYFADVRPVVERDGALIMADDERMRLRPGEEPMMKRVRFRTLGCYPLTGAIESDATTLPEIIEEMLLAKNSERQGRVIDHDETGSMEQKKREGYF